MTTAVPGSSPAHPRPRTRGSVALDGAGWTVEPLASLDWAMAVELPGRPERIESPARGRLAWIHQAPDAQVLTLYRKAKAVDPTVVGAWWLRALDRGLIDSRSEAFDLEDQVHKTLTSRPGWVYVPWVGDGETGYWEYEPGEGDGWHPTTIMMTDRHSGWLDASPPHRGNAVLPVPLTVDGLVAALPELEIWRIKTSS